MGILIDKNTHVIVQGMTGREGRRATKEMIDYGTNIVCGVTPGKGGQEVEGKPIYDSVREAKQAHPKLNTSVLLVPPLLVYDAAMEAIHAKLDTVLIVTENVPVKDSAKLIAYAEKNGVRLIGPSSIGVISVGQAKIGSIGGAKEQDMYSKGPVGIISKSGGMCAETALLLTQNGIGQSTVVGIGGDVLIGTTFTDVLALFEKDPDTKVVVIYGEIGGSYEEQIADMIKAKQFTKPLVAFISGRFAETFSRGMSVGHAGAIIQREIGKYIDKKNALISAGAQVAKYHFEIAELVKKVLK